METIWAKLISPIFTAAMGPVWRALVGYFAPGLLWNSCFRAGATTAEIEPRLALALAKAPALERLMINTFKSDRVVPTAMDFAVSLSFELHELGLSSGGIPPSSNIKNFAVDVRRAWLNGVIENVTLRNRFQSARGEHPAKYITVDSSCLDAKGLVLDDVGAVQRRYFENFAAPDATEIVCVWLPDIEGNIHYEPQNRRIVEVALNTSFGADRGFFRVGYDYSIKRSGDRLHVCFLNTQTKMEAGHFGQYCVGRATSMTLWAR